MHAFCDVLTGRPPPTVTWFKNNTLLRSGNNCKLFKQGGSHFVEIGSAEFVDVGNYTICVENPAGAVFWTIQIDVEGLCLIVLNLKYYCYQ